MFLKSIKILDLALDMAQMVLDVWEHLKAAQVFMLNKLCFNNFAQITSPEAVLALGLLLAVFGPGHGSDGPGCLEKP